MTPPRFALGSRLRFWQCCLLLWTGFAGAGRRTQGGGRTAAAKAADKLHARGVQTVILTLGARGAFVATTEVRQLVPGFKVKAVDTTAAGDIFNGALAGALAEGQDLIQAVRVPNAASAISVTRMGAQPSASTRKEIERLLRSTAG